MPAGISPFKENEMITTSITIQDAPKIPEPMQSQVRSLGRELMVSGIIVNEKNEKRMIRKVLILRD